uniref:Ubiquitin-like protease family profile domain-containing protein n=1 Tax=Stomoxys calcitrans TaxID=35570 RepID=A0A1I8Q2I5_STOCA
MMGVFVEPDPKKHRISNSPVESYFNVIKKYTIEGRCNIRSADYVRRSMTYIKAKLKEVGNECLDSDISFKKTKARNQPLDEEHWRRTPHKAKRTFNKNLVFEKLVKKYNMLPRKKKNDRYVLLKFDDIYQKRSMDVTFPPTIDISEFKSLEGTNFLYSNVVDIFITIQLSIHGSQLTKSFNCEEGAHYFYSDTDQQLPIENYKQVIIPIIHQSHFTLVIINTENKTFTFIDPLGECKGKLDHLLTTFVSKNNATSYIPTTVPHAIQADTFNCDVHVCQFVEAILTSSDLRSIENPNTSQTQS